MPRIRRQFSGEALLREILAAPIVLTVMAGDRTTKSEVEILIATVRRRLASAQAALREGSPSGDMIAGDGLAPASDKTRDYEQQECEGRTNVRHAGLAGEARHSLSSARARCEL